MYNFLVIGSAQLGSISAKIAYYAHNHNMRTVYRRKLVDPSKDAQYTITFLDTYT